MSAFNSTIALVNERLRTVRGIADSAKQNWQRDTTAAAGWKKALDGHMLEIADLEASLKLLKVNQGLVDRAGHDPVPAQKGE